MFIQKYHEENRESPSDQIERVPVSSYNRICIHSFNDCSETLCEFFKLISSIVRTNQIYFDAYCYSKYHKYHYWENRWSIFERRAKIEFIDINKTCYHKRRGLGMQEGKGAIPKQPHLQFFFRDGNAIENYSRKFLTML